MQLRQCVFLESLYKTVAFGVNQEIEPHKQGTHQESRFIPLAEQPEKGDRRQNEFKMLND